MVGFMEKKTEKDLKDMQREIAYMWFWEISVPDKGNSNMGMSFSGFKKK